MKTDSGYWEEGKNTSFFTIDESGRFAQSHPGMVGKSHTRTRVKQDRYLVMEVCRNIDYQRDSDTNTIDRYVLYVTGHRDLTGSAVGMVVGGSYADFVYGSVDGVELEIASRLTAFVVERYCTRNEFKRCMREIQYALRIENTIVNRERRC